MAEIATLRSRSPAVSQTPVLLRATALSDVPDTVRDERVVIVRSMAMVAWAWLMTYVAFSLAPLYWGWCWFSRGLRRAWNSLPWARPILWFLNLVPFTYLVLLPGVFIVGFFVRLVIVLTNMAIMFMLSNPQLMQTDTILAHFAQILLGRGGGQ